MNSRTLLHVLVGTAACFDIFCIFGFVTEFPGLEKWIGSFLISLVLIGGAGMYWEMKLQDLFGSKFDWLDVLAAAVVGNAVGVVLGNLWPSNIWLLWSLNVASIFFVGRDLVKYYNIKHKA